MSIVKNTLGLNASETAPAELSFTRNSVGTRVNNIGNIETVGSNIIRLDYDTVDIGRSLGWLLEETSTNNIVQSQDFTAAEWTSSATTAVIANNYISPTGDSLAATKADRLASSGATGKCSVKQSQTFTTGQTYSVSVFARKNANVTFLEIAPNEVSGASTTFSQVFNLDTGVVGSAEGTVSNVSMKSYPDEWYRCELTFTADANTQQEISLIARNDDAHGTDTTLGTQAGIYIWGMQVETLPYATSYIPTTATPVVRASDDASVMTTESVFNWQVGATVFMEGRTLGGVGSPLFHYMDSGSNVMGGNPGENTITYYNDGKVSLKSGGVSQLANLIEATGITVTPDEKFRAGITFSAGRLQAVHNTSLAAAPFPVAIADLPTNVSGSDYAIKFFHGDGLPHSSGHLKSFRIIPQSYTDGELSYVTARPEDTIVDPLSGAAGSVIYDGTITGAKLANGTITGDKIANDSITSAHLIVDVIVAEDLANNAIGIGELQDNAVIASKIATNAVDGTKVSLATEATGDIMYFNGTDWVVLPKGTEDHVLKIASGIPAWGADSTSDGTPTFDASSPMGSNINSHVTGTIELNNIRPNKVSIIELAVTDSGNSGDVLSTNGAGVLSFITPAAGDPTMGGDLSGLGSAALIINNAVTTVKIADGAVNSDKLKSHATIDLERAVGTDHIKSLSVTDAKLATGAVTGLKIPNNTITTSHIVDSTITDSDLANNAVTNLKIANLAVTNSKIATDAITEVKIADGAVTNNKLAANSITSDKILLDIIVAEDLAANSVTFSELQDDAVRTAKIQDGAVTAVKLAAGVIVAQTISANAVNGTHLQMGSDLAGDILYYNGTDYTRLGVGSNDQVLTVSSGSPTWVTGASGGVSAAAATATAVTMAIALG